MTDFANVSFLQEYRLRGGRGEPARSVSPALSGARRESFERGRRADPEKVIGFVAVCELGAFNVERALELAAGTGRYIRAEDLETLKRAAIILEREAALNTPAEEVAS